MVAHHVVKAYFERNFLTAGCVALAVFGGGVELDEFAVCEFAHHFQRGAVVFEDGLGHFEQFGRKERVRRVAPRADVVGFPLFGDADVLLPAHFDVFLLPFGREQPFGGMKRVNDVAQQDDIQFLNRAILAAPHGCKVGILPQTFGKQVKGAGGDGCGSRAVAQVQVADDDKHIALL